MREHEGRGGSPGEGCGGRILVAEDNPLNRKLISTILESEGYRVTLVENGRLAVEAARGGAFDLVLMDLQMPEMDGVEAARRIREDPAGADLPIVAVTAFLAEVGLDRCWEAGMNAYLEKPFSRGHLLEVVRRWLGVGGKRGDGGQRGADPDLRGRARGPGGSGPR